MIDSEIAEYLRMRNAEMNYDIEPVIKQELENYHLFDKHPELKVPPASLTDHYKFYPLAFNKDILTGTGILEVGCGESGPFLLEQNTRYFQPPRVAVDPYQAAAPEPQWKQYIMGGQKIVETFGVQSFDFVQFMEAAEHIPQEESHDVAKQCLQCARKYCWLTSAPIAVHIGLNTKAFLDRNSFMGYHGQPNIEVLADMGYKIQLVTGYGFSDRACRIFATWDLQRDGKHKFM